MKSHASIGGVFFGGTLKTALVDAALFACWTPPRLAAAPVFSETPRLMAAKNAPHVMFSDKVFLFAFVVRSLEIVSLFFFL